jgi:hypothetical protein
MKRLTQGALVGVLILALASVATAQGTLQVPSGAAVPALRFGNFIEVGNDVLMHIIATNDFRYNTTESFDFERKVRDRVASRNPQDNIEQTGEGDIFWMLIRFGVDFRYQKSTELQIVLEQRTQLDGNTSDDRMNSTNPGGTDIFGRGTSTENKGFYCKYCWLDYKFEGTPLRFRVGFDLWTLDQAGYLGDNDPRFAVFGDFGDLDVMAAAVVQFESQRLGLTNDNDLIYYTFSAGYNLKPHRFQVDVAYFRDRFNGADTIGTGTVPAIAGTAGNGAVGFRGQKQDVVLVTASWSGQAGPVRGLVQGAGLFGHAKGANAAGIALANLTGLRGPDRDYDVLAGSAVAYGEVDLGLVRPFLMALWGSGDGDPTDHKLHGFSPTPFREITVMTGTTWFAHLDTSDVFARDYSCPARAQGLGVANVNTPGVASTTNPGAPGIVGRSGPYVPAANPSSVFVGAQNPYAQGVTALGGLPAGGVTECSHTVGNPFNDRLANTSHLGINTTLGNPGTGLGIVGIRVFPLKGYEINAWYLYRTMLNTRALRAAFAPELAVRAPASRDIRLGEYQEVGGTILWTLNPSFDIRLAGSVAFPLGGYYDLAHLANCNASNGGGAYGSSARCGGKDLPLHGEVRFRARF